MANGEITTTNGKALQPADKYQSLRSLLARNETSIAQALPKHLSVERITRLALTCIRMNPDLLDVDQASFLSAVLTCSQLGLEPDGVTGMAYLIPFWNRKRKPPVLECQFIPGYQGLKALAYRTGKVQFIQARAVYQSDVFRMSYGLEEKLEHIPSPTGWGAEQVVGVYGVALLDSGVRVFEYMSAEEVESIRQATPSHDSPAWRNHWVEMAKKTAIRRLCKSLPRSVELANAIFADEKAEIGEPQNLSDLIGNKAGGLDPEMEIKDTMQETVRKANEVLSGEPTPEERAEIERREKEEAAAHAQPKRTPKPAPKTTVVLDPGLRSNGEPWDE